MFRWPWKSNKLTPRERAETLRAEREVQVSVERTAQVHKEVAEILAANHLTRMFHNAMLPKGGK